MITKTDVCERYAPIIAKMSVSLRLVSSKPGVSINVTSRPLSLKGFVACTSLVQLSRLLPIAKSDPLASLMTESSRSVVSLDKFHCW